MNKWYHNPELMIPKEIISEFAPGLVNETNRSGYPT